MKKNTLLIFPPHWCTSHPYLSIPCLSAYLKKNGVNVRIKDFNLLTQEKMLSKDYLLSLQRKEVYKPVSFKSVDDYVITRIEQAVKTFKSDMFFNSEIYNKSRDVIDYAYKMISKSFEPLVINRNSLSFTNDDTFDYNYFSVFLKDSSINPFIEIFEELLTEESLSNLKHIAISVTDFLQVYPTLTIAKMIKNINKNIHITVGGIAFSKMHDNYGKLNCIFEWVDSIIMFEGEKPLLKLIEAIYNSESFENIPNLIYKDPISHKIIKTDYHLSNISLNELPVPDFTEYSKHSYLTPKKILPYFTTKKCYWGKCTFCDHDSTYDNKFRIKNRNQIYHELRTYIDQYDAKIIHFIDSAMPPKLINMICNIILDNNLKIQWYGYIRADNAYNYALIRKMKKSGCVFVQIGAESFSQSVLNSMNKGTNVVDIKEVITRFDNVGIWAHLFLIGNFPTEKLIHKVETAQFILENQLSIHSLGYSNFTLLIDTPIYNEPHKFNIESIGDRELFKCGVSHKKYAEIDENFIDSKCLLPEHNSFQRMCNQTICFRDHLPVLLSKFDFIKHKKLLNDFIEGNSMKEKFKVSHLVINQMKENFTIFNFNTAKGYKINRKIAELIKKIEMSHFTKNQYYEVCKDLQIESESMDKIFDLLVESESIQLI